MAGGEEAELADEVGDGDGAGLLELALVAPPKSDQLGRNELQLRSTGGGEAEAEPKEVERGEVEGGAPPLVEEEEAAAAAEVAAAAEPVPSMLNPVDEAVPIGAELLVAALIGVAKEETGGGSGGNAGNGEEMLAWRGEVAAEGSAGRCAGSAAEVADAATVAGVVACTTDATTGLVGTKIDEPPPMLLPLKPPNPLLPMPRFISIGLN